MTNGWTYTIYSPIVSFIHKIQTLLLTPYISLPQILNQKYPRWVQTLSQAQHAYHRALQTKYPNHIKIIKGYYAFEKGNMLKYKQPPDKSDRVEVWRLEEKQTDVNIALTAYRDAIQNKAQQVVFVSNDTDLEPALRALREDLGDAVTIGVLSFR